MKIKVIAFDLFGTVFDMSSVSHSQMKEYGDTIREPEWRYFKYHPSWIDLPLFSDSEDGLEELRCKGYLVVTLSNAPIALQVRLCSELFDALVPLEMAKVYKPNPEAYKILPRLIGVDFDECLMVSANKSFGDIEASKKLGMNSQLIRGGSEVIDIIDLASRM